MGQIMNDEQIAFAEKDLNEILADEFCDFGLVMSLRDAGHDLLI